MEILKDEMRIVVAALRSIELMRERDADSVKRRGDMATFRRYRNTVGILKQVGARFQRMMDETAKDFPISKAEQNLVVAALEDAAITARANADHLLKTGNLTGATQQGKFAEGCEAVRAKWQRAKITGMGSGSLN